MSNSDELKHETGQDLKSTTSTQYSIPESPHQPIQHLRGIVLSLKQLNLLKVEGKHVEAIDFQGIEFSIMKTVIFLNGTHNLVGEHKKEQIEIFAQLVHSIFEELNNYVNPHSSHDVDQTNYVWFKMFEKSIKEPLLPFFKDPNASQKNIQDVLTNFVAQIKKTTNDAFNQQTISTTASNAVHSLTAADTGIDPDKTTSKVVQQQTPRNVEKLENIHPAELSPEQNQFGISHGKQELRKKTPTPSMSLSFIEAMCNFIFNGISGILSKHFKSEITKVKTSTSNEPQPDEEMVERKAENTENTENTENSCSQQP